MTKFDELTETARKANEEHAAAVAAYQADKTADNLQRTKIAFASKREAQAALMEAAEHLDRE